MLRCVLAGALLACSMAANAQLARNFPASALRGEFVVTQPPEVLLNGKAARLAPGARIRGMDNRLVLSGEAVSQRLVVHYTLDLHGQVLDVWILNPAEAARQPWPRTPQEAAGWSFNFDAQAWSKP